MIIYGLWLLGSKTSSNPVSLKLLYFLTHNNVKVIMNTRFKQNRNISMNKLIFSKLNSKSFLIYHVNMTLSVMPCFEHDELRPWILAILCFTTHLIPFAF